MFTIIFLLAITYVVKKITTYNGIETIASILEGTNSLYSFFYFQIFKGTTPVRDMNANSVNDTYVPMKALT